MSALAPLPPGSPEGAPRGRFSAHPSSRLGAECLGAETGHPKKTAREARPWGWWLALAIALLGHLLALYVPGSPEPSRLEIPGLDKVVHLGLFFVPAYLVRRLIRPTWPLLLLLVHAPVSEAVQWGLVPHRSGDLVDMVADIAGVALGWWLADRAESAHGRAT